MRKYGCFFVRNVFYFSKKVRLFSQNDVLFLFYFLINPAGTTVFVDKWMSANESPEGSKNTFITLNGKTEMALHNHIW